jgi:hypothetical protein
MTLHDGFRLLAKGFDSLTLRPPHPREYTPAESVLLTMKMLRRSNPAPKVLAVIEEIEAENTCHCGEPVTYGFDGDPIHHRGMCAHCDRVRCDAYPGDCKR